MTEVYRVGAYQVSDRVLRAVQNASASTGVDFSYMMAKAAQESAFRADVKAPTSSATGLYQFIDSTWLGMVKKHGAEHGLGRYADQIEPGRGGRWTVTDPAMRREILGLRTNPEVAAMMAAEFALDNQDHLQRTVGGKIGPTELYFAHFLGAGGAQRFLSALRANPNQSGAAMLPDAARANRSIFYANGHALTLKQIYDNFDRRVKNGLELAEAVPAGFRADTVRTGPGDTVAAATADGAAPVTMPRAVFDWLRIQPRIIHPAVAVGPLDAPEEHGVKVVRANAGPANAFDLSLFSVLANSADSAEQVAEAEPAADPEPAMPRVIRP